MNKNIYLLLICIFTLSCKTKEEKADMHIAKALVLSDDVIFKYNTLRHCIATNERWREIVLYALKNETWTFAKVHMLQCLILNYPNFIEKQVMIKFINEIEAGDSNNDLESDGAWDDLLEWRNKQNQ